MTAISTKRAIEILSDWTLLSCETDKAKKKGIAEAEAALKVLAGPIHMRGLSAKDYDTGTYQGQLALELHSAEVAGWNKVFESEENTNRFEAEFSSGK